MNSKRFKITALYIVLIMVIFCFAGCNENLNTETGTGDAGEGSNAVSSNGNENACTHIAVSDPSMTATCTKAGLTEGSHCSICNEVFVAQQILAALGHDFSKGEICLHCGISYTVGLEYTLIENGTAYEVSGIGTVTDTDIIITNVYEGLPVTRIGSDAFYDCVNLKSVTIPNTVTSIGSYAFEKCNSLTSINIPDDVTLIGEGAFAFCYSLTEITLPNNLTIIEAKVFGACKGLKTISLPNGIISIGNEAFADCSSLTNINIPDRATLPSLHPQNNHCYL